MPKGIKKAEEAQGLVFFGDVDRKNKVPGGQIASSYPAWYNEQLLDEMKEGVDAQQRALDSGRVPSDSVPVARERLNRERKRLEEIERSRPKLNKQSDAWLTKVTKNLQDQIAPTLFTKEEMKFGDASPHEEMRRNKYPCIKIDHELAGLCGVKPVKGGLVSRDEAIRCWKIASKALGKETNSEKMRKSVMTARTTKPSPFVGEPDTGPEEDLMDGRETALQGIEGAA